MTSFSISFNVSRYNLEILSMKVDELRLTQGEPKHGVQTLEEQMPTTIIASYLKGKTADKIIQIQDELINHGVHGSLRTAKDNLFITYVAMFNNDELENIFNDTVRCLKGAPELNFELGELTVSRSGKLVIKIKQGDAANISSLFLYNCMKQNVPCSDLYSGIKLFTPCYEDPNCYDNLSSREANEYWSKHAASLEYFQIQEIVACRL